MPVADSILGRIPRVLRSALIALGLGSGLLVASALSLPSVAGFSCPEDGVRRGFPVAFFLQCPISLLPQPGDVYWESTFERLGLLSDLVFWTGVAFVLLIVMRRIREARTQRAATDP